MGKSRSLSGFVEVVDTLVMFDLGPSVVTRRTERRAREWPALCKAAPPGRPYSKNESRAHARRIERSLVF